MPDDSSPDPHPHAAVSGLPAGFDPGAFSLAAPPAGFVDDPWPYWAAVRARQPVLHLPDGAWLFTRHADVAAVYLDDAFSSDKRALFGPKFGVGSALFHHHTTSLVFNDPPLHSRVRETLVAALRPRAIQATVAVLEQVVERLLDRIAAQGTFDLIADYASQIPVEIISSLLTVPVERRTHLREWSLAILGALEPALDARDHAIGNAAVEAFTAALRELVAWRRRQPSGAANDVLAALVARHDAGDLSEAELLQNCIFLLNAGHETTTNLIGNGVHALLTHPHAAAAVRADPALVRHAVEETLRWASPNQIGNRAVSRPVTIGGQPLQPGDQVVLAIGAANRDPAVFDHPDTFDLRRAANPHLAFATGAHACVGAALARIEGRIAIAALLRRFPRLRLAGAPVQRARLRFRGFDAVPLAVE